MAVFAGGGLLTQYPASFSTDGKLLFVPCGNSVNVYDAYQQNLLLRIHAHSRAVTCVLTTDADAGKVYTASLDGMLRLWDCTTGVRLQQWQIGIPIVSLAITGSATDQVAHISCSWADGDAGRVLFVRLRDGAVLPRRLKMTRACKLACNGNTVAAWDRRTIFVWTHAAAGMLPPRVMQHTKAFTCVAVAPGGLNIAAGDESGRILIWHNVRQYLPGVNGTDTAEATDEAYDPRTDISSTTVHWHAHPVGAVAFTSEGSYLLSGGYEAVLVQWKLETGDRQYLPRLGGPIVQITQPKNDASRWLVALSVNTLRIVSLATRKVEGSIYGILPPSDMAYRHPRSAALCAPLPPARGPSGAPAGAPAAGSKAAQPAQSAAGADMQHSTNIVSASEAVSPGSPVFVLPSTQCVVQYYSPLQDASLAALQTSPRNIVARTRADAPLIMKDPSGGPLLEPFVCDTACSTDGRCLATVEARPAVTISGQDANYCLQFWECGLQYGPALGSASVQHALASSFDYPHGDHAVTSCSYCPGQDLVCTTAMGGTSLLGGPSEGGAKLWRRTDTPVPGSGGLAVPKWHETASISYRGLPMTCSAFSSDASLLALGCRGSIVFWRTSDFARVAIVPLPEDNQLPLQMVFIPNTPYLVVNVPGTLCVINLLVPDIMWSIDLVVSAMAADPIHSAFAVAITMSGSTQQQGPKKGKKGDKKGDEKGKGKQKKAPAEKKADGQTDRQTDGQKKGQTGAEKGQKQDAEEMSESEDEGAPQGAPEGDAMQEDGEGAEAASRHLGDEWVQQSLTPQGRRQQRIGSVHQHHRTWDHILVFDAQRPSVRQAWQVTGNGVQLLHFLQPGQTDGQTERAAYAAGYSPLLFLTADRRFQLVQHGAEGAVEGVEKVAGAVVREKTALATVSEAVQSLEKDAQKGAKAVPGGPWGPANKSAMDLLAVPSHNVGSLTLLSERFLKAKLAGDA